MHRPQLLRRSLLRRLRSAMRPATAWLLVVTYAAAALGVPLPMPTVVDPSGQPFPCQANRCGCHTAEQCWKSCCCHTNREKLVWAAAHGVTPPSYVIVAAAHEARSCPTQSCCAHKHAPDEASSSTAAAPTATTSIIWISALDGRRCRGETPLWQNVPISLPSTAPLAAPSFEPCVRPLAAYDSAAPFCPSFTPPDPPPWIS